MRAWGALRAAALLGSFLWATPLLAKDPNFQVSEFENIPRFLNYFRDSDTVLFHDIDDNNVYLSHDAGEKWERVKDVPEGKAWWLFMHEFDPERAYILTEGHEHWRTIDRGKSWQHFSSLVPTSGFRRDILRFHADDKDRVIFNGMICSGLGCGEVTTYTTDGFETPAEPLRLNTDGCWWAKSSELFTTGNDDLDKHRILCIARDELSPDSKADQRLFISDNYFKPTDESEDIQEFEPDLDTNKFVRGVVNVAAVKKFFLVATTSDNTDEMALFISTDTLKWHRAMFPAPHEGHDHRVKEEAYTVLEGTNYSIQVDVLSSRPSRPMGILFTSNSDGTYFTENIEHTNRDRRGHVDFEKIAGIQGIFLVNKVDNAEEYEKGKKGKKVISEITFNDGRTFEPIKTVDGEDVHLHSVTELSNVGRVFSSQAPGLVMGIGNTGKELGSYWDDGSLFVSDDAGKTWTKALDGPHKYEFGDQGSILVAVRDSREHDIGEISYSLDHGQTWDKVSLPKNIKMRPYILTSTQDATTLKFLLIGEVEGKKQYQVISIDFEGLHEAVCKDDDLEEWFARVDNDKKPVCLMGHTQSFQRRKKDAKCFLKKAFKHLDAKTEDCDCTDADYECDFNFERDGDDKCVARGPIPIPEGECRDGKPDATFKGTSGYRKIPGNTCKPTKEMDEKYKPVEWKCSEGAGKPSLGPVTDEIKQNLTLFSDSFEVIYLERGHSSSDKSETVIMRGRGGDVQISYNHGQKWEELKKFKGKKITEIIVHPVFQDMVFFLTKDKVWVTDDGGKTFMSFEPPSELDKTMNSPLAFHPDHKDWIIWMGDRKEDSERVVRMASVSEDRGDNWKTIGRKIGRCEFTGSKAFRYPQRSEKQILCTEDEDGGGSLSLVSSNDFFEHKTEYAKNVSGFATMSEFIVVAAKEEGKETLVASVSLDGVTFAEVRFPPNFVLHPDAYTVLDSSAHAVRMFVPNNPKRCDFGTIMKSNSNGTSYVVSVRNVNANDDCYVDFEKMQGLEGVLMVNVVVNHDEVAAGKANSKALRSLISHNDGAKWSFLSPPSDDEFGKFPCRADSGSEKCALHLHGYTQRPGNRKMSSLESAVGIMLGWGNVGDSLGSINEADTFLTTDAGITWKRVKKGQYWWAIGDQGGIIVLVATEDRGQKKTKVLDYSFDRGQTWKEHVFSEEEVEVKDMATLRSGSSHKFLLWGKRADGEDFTLSLDFGGFNDRFCSNTNSPDTSESDYETYVPEHPLQGNGCLFGHQLKYLRKKTDAKCWNPFTLPKIYKYENCTCQREDYECDYNFEMTANGECKPSPGTEPISREEWCKAHPDADEWWEPSGYRRVPLSTCIDEGMSLDKQTTVHACPGHEEQFERKHRVSGVVVFFAVVMSVLLAAGAGWYMWRNWSGKFGQIRLGESGSSAFEADQPWIKYPIIAVSAVVAVVSAIPLVVGGLWRATKGVAERWGLFGSSRGSWTRLAGGSIGGGSTRRFTTRDSFARGPSGDYDIVDEDEGELLGDESDDEV